MAFQIVAAPARQFKTYTMLLAVALGSFDAFVLLVKAFADTHIVSPETAVLINAVAAFLLVPLKLLQQNIPVTTEQKIELVEAAAATPMKPGEQDVPVSVAGSEVNTTR